jgi:hypothetical protein
MWAQLESKAITYVAHNYEDIWCNARTSLELLDREQLQQILMIQCGLKE